MVSTYQRSLQNSQNLSEEKDYAKHTHTYTHTCAHAHTHTHTHKPTTITLYLWVNNSLTHLNKDIQRMYSFTIMLLAVELLYQVLHTGQVNSSVMLPSPLSRGHIGGS